jgi:anti-sigma factor RsiW
MDYLDGELTPEDTQHLREHLRGCAPCVDFLRTYRATPGVCKRAMAQRMPQEVAEKLTEFLRSKIKSAS